MFVSHVCLSRLFSGSCLDFVRIHFIAIAQKPIAVLDQVDQLAISPHLLQVRHFMPYQGVVQFIAWSHVNDVPKASPPMEATGFHVEQDWARGSADHGVAAAL